MFRMSSGPMYDPADVQPMRDELTAVGIKELLTPADVDAALLNQTGTQLVVINSVCGCAAGGARPGVAASLQNGTIPDKLYTVFAGMEKEAVARVRELIVHYPPSSPSVALFKDGKVVFFLERMMIEGRSPEQIAMDLMDAYDKHCTAKGPSIPAEQYDKLGFAQVCGSKLLAKARAAGRV